MQNNTNTGKTIGIVIIVLIILAAVWLMTRKSGSTAENAPAASTSTSTTGTAAQPTAVSGIQSGGSSNAQLDSDTAAIDAQMQTASSDNTAAQSTTTAQ